MNNYRKQMGVSLLLVLFILAVISIMAISIANITGTQHLNTSYAIQRAQAYFAARAGMDYAAARISAGLSCADITPSINLAGYSVTINCAAVGTYDEGGPSSFTIYSLTVLASKGVFSAPNVINRQIRATIL